MGSNGAKHEILPYKATGAPAPKDGPDRVHTYALLRATIEFSNGVKNSVWGITCSLTYIKLSNRNGVHCAEELRFGHVVCRKEAAYACLPVRMCASSPLRGRHLPIGKA